MGTAQRLEQIQEYLMTKADDRFVNLVYEMVQADLSGENYELSPAHKKLLDERLEAHESNPSQGRSWQAVKSSLLSK